MWSLDGRYEKEKKVLLCFCDVLSLLIILWKFCRFCTFKIILQFFLFDCYLVVCLIYIFFNIVETSHLFPYCILIGNENYTESNQSDFAFPWQVLTWQPPKSSASAPLLNVLQLLIFFTSLTIGSTAVFTRQSDVIQYHSQFISPSYSHLPLTNPLKNSLILYFNLSPHLLSWLYPSFHYFQSPALLTVYVSIQYNAVLHIKHLTSVFVNSLSKAQSNVTLEK